MTVNYQNDHWTTEIEKLGFEGAGDHLVNMILQAPPPFAVSVNGKWGSGKTSLMRYAMASLGGVLLKTTMPGNSEGPEELSGNFKEKYTAIFSDLKKSEIAKRIMKIADYLAKRPETEHGQINDALNKRSFPLRCVWFNPWQYQNDPNQLIPLLHEIRSQVVSCYSISFTTSNLLQYFVHPLRPYERLGIFIIQTDVILNGRRLARGTPRKLI